MNFDRKFGNMQHEPGENNKGFAEFSPLNLDAAQQVSADNAADYLNPAGELYPSGAFPALNVAYSEHNIQNPSGAFTSAKDFSANAEQSRYNDSAGGSRPQAARFGAADQHFGESGAGEPGGGGAYAAETAGGSEPRRQQGGQRFVLSPYDAARSESGMASRGYTDEEQAYRRPGGGRDAAYAPSPLRHDGQSQNGYPSEAPAAPAEFAESGFHGDLGGESSVQAACFDSSDYDYAYQPDGAAPAHSAGQQPYQQGSAYYDSAAAEQSFPPRGGAPQQADFADENAAYDNAAYYDEPYRQDYAPQQAGSGQDYRAEPQEQGFAAPPGGYERQNTPPEGNEADYRGYETGGLPPQEEEPQQAYEADYPHQAFAEESVLPFDTPYTQDDEAVAADFDRLSADVSRIDRIAGGLPSGGEDGAFFAPPPQERGYEPGAAHYGQPGRGDGFFAAAEPRGAEQSAAARREPEAEFADMSAAPDERYDDELYDWTAPAGAGSAAPGFGLPRQMQKSRKTLYLAACLLAAALVSVFAYWLYARSSSGGSGGEPVIVHKSAEPYKIKPQGSGQNAANLQEQSVTDGISNADNSGNPQKSLIDKTEQPVEMQKMEERLPFEEQKPFDRSAVDSLIKTVIAQATPVHIVPGIRVDGNRKIISSSLGGEAVLIPGKEAAAGSAAADENGEAAAGIAAAKSAALPQIAVKEKRGAIKSAAPPERAAAGTAPPKPQKFSALPPKIKTAAVSGGSFFMQISSQPTREAAEQSMREAKKHLSAAVADKMKIVSAVIPDKGTYYRVRILADSREEAGRLCETYKQSGGHCFVAR